jgi:hypothetical protein
MDSFTAMMWEVEEGKKSVVISVLENIIVDEAKASGNEDRSKNIKDVIKKAMALIETTSIRLPKSKFCIVMPLIRPAVNLYKGQQAAFEKEICEGIPSLKSFNVTRVNCMCYSCLIGTAST